MGPLDDFLHLKTDDQRWIWMAGQITSIKTVQNEQRNQIAGILGEQSDEVAGCMFHPSRQQNGGNIIKRIDRLERGVLLAIGIAIGVGLLEALPLLGGLGKLLGWM